MQDEAISREEIVATARRLETTGLNVGSTGNVSVRSKDGLLITPTGAMSQTLKPGDVVPMRLDGKVLSGGLPSSEWAFHAVILRERPEFGAVIHTHADACTAVSCLRRDIPPFHYLVAGFGGNDVRCATYASFGSDALAEAVRVAMTGRRACLLANHGMIVAAHDLAQALLLAEKLETLARQYLLACQGGEPVVLSEADMANVHQRYTDYGKRPMNR